MKRFRDAIESGEFVITAELGPPKGTDVSKIMEVARCLRGRVHGVNVTDNTAAVMRASGLALCRLLFEMGHDSILQVTGRDRNRIAIQSDLLGAHILGIRNILCLTGDFVTVGDHKEAKPVYDLESVQLLKVIDRLNSGRDLAGNDLKGPTDLYPGAAVSPEIRPLEPLLSKFEKKIAAGARFFQTQAIYQLDRFSDFMKHARQHKVKILAGILLLKSARMAEYINRHIPGIKVPEPMIEELRVAGKERSMEMGIDIAVRTIFAIREICDGVHIMAPRMEEHIVEILDRAGL